MPTTTGSSTRPAPVIYLDEPFASVRWEDPWVTMEWKAFCSSAQFRATQEALLLAVIENGAQRLLTDIRHGKVILSVDERWLVEDMLPRLARTSLRFTALVMPYNALALVIATDISKAAQPQDGISTTEQFASIELAKAWLWSRETLASTAKR